MQHVSKRHDAEVPRFALGRLSIAIDDEVGSLGPLIDELTPVRHRGLDQPQLVIRSTSAVPRTPGQLERNWISVAPEHLNVKRHDFEYRLERVTGDEPSSAIIHVRGPRHPAVPRWAYRLRSRQYSSACEATCQNIYYMMLDYVTHLRGLPLGQSYIHASTMTKDGVGVAVAGWGGVGKSASVLEMVWNRGWSYLSDDLAIIDVDGTLYYNPKNLTIYPYSIEGTAQADHLIAEFSGLNRAHWFARKRLFGPKGTRRRLPSRTVFGDAAHTASSAPLRHLVVLERSDVNEPVRREADARSAAAALANVMLSELSPMVEVAARANSSEHAPQMPNVAVILRDTEAVIYKAIANTCLSILHVPHSWSPSQTASSIEELVRDGTQEAC